MAFIEQRVAALESEAFQTRAGITHLTDAIGDLSQQARATAFDLREFRRETAERLDRLETSVSQVDQRLDRVEGVLGQILDRLPRPE